MLGRLMETGMAAAVVERTLAWEAAGLIHRELCPSPWCPFSEWQHERQLPFPPRQKPESALTSPSPSFPMFPIIHLMTSPPKL